MSNRGGTVVLNYIITDGGKIRSGLWADN